MAKLCEWDELEKIIIKISRLNLGTNKSMIMLQIEILKSYVALIEIADNNKNDDRKVGMKERAINLNALASEFYSEAIALSYEENIS